MNTTCMPLVRVLALGLLLPLTVTHAALSADLRRVPHYGEIPMRFEVNQGQTDGRVDFLARGKGYTLFLTPGAAVLTLRSPHNSGSAACVLRMQLLEAGNVTAGNGLEPVAGTVNYYRGNRPDQWCTGIAQFGAVEYCNVYRGIDLLYHGNQRRLEYDFVVAPGADPHAIKLAFVGAQTVRLSAAGDLIVALPGGELAFHQPEIYQTTQGVRHPVSGRYCLLDQHAVGFEVDAYDRTQPLVIDPVLVYATYLGGGGDDFGAGIAVDSASHAYVTGQTMSSDFPSDGELAGNSDVFVTQFNAAGNGVVYSTYLGGAGDDGGNGIALDSAFNAYVVGATTSTDFPMLGAVQESSGGAVDAFVMKLDGTGALVFSTYLGGGSDDVAFAVAVDAAGVYVVGETISGNYPTTTNAFQASCGTDASCNLTVTTNITVAAGLPATNIVTEAFSDAFLTRLSLDGGALIYSSYYGGENNDVARAVAVDGAGNVFVAGGTHSVAFPVNAGQFKDTCGDDEACDGLSDAFVFEQAPDGSLPFATYIGGDGDEEATGVMVDGGGQVYVVGSTTSDDFPVTIDVQHPADAVFGEAHGGADIFAVQFGAAGTNLVLGIVLGGEGDDFPNGAALLPAGNLVIAGETSSTDFPIYHPLQKTLSGDTDAFVLKLIPAGTNFVYSTYLGGSNDDAATGLAVQNSSVYLAGRTTSGDFPTVNPFEANNAGGEDAFVAKFDSIETDLGISVTTVSTSSVGAVMSYTIVVSNLGSITAHNVVVHDYLPGVLAFDSADVPTTVDGRLVDFAVGDINADESATAIFNVRVLYPLATCNQFVVSADEDDPNPDNNQSQPCVEIPVHDLAFTQMRAPKRIKLGATGTLTVTFQNRSPATETIPDLATLNNLITLTVESLGTNCAPVTPVLQSPKKGFPLTIAPKHIARVVYTVAFPCANDPEKTTNSSGHNDFAFTAALHHEAIDGLLDSHPEDDSCPRAPLLGGRDTFPDGTVVDKGCRVSATTDVIAK